MTTEKYANAASTTLNGAINNSTTTVVVTSASGFPTTGQFRIIVVEADNTYEIMLVTGVSGNTFTVATRGTIDGSAAISHANGATVKNILTKSALDQIFADNTQYGAYASLPAVERAGRIYKANDSPYLFYDNGSVWKCLGPVFNFTLPPAATGGPSATQFGWINQGSITLSTTGGIIYLEAPTNAADSWTFLIKNLPATPYVITVHLVPSLPGVNYAGTAMVLRKASDGQWIGFQHYWNNGLSVSVGHGTNTGPAITVDDSGTVQVQEAYKWLRISDDGANRTFKLSRDGIDDHFLQFYTQAHATPFVPDQIGIGLEARQTTKPVGLGLWSWLEA